MDVPKNAISRDVAVVSRTIEVCASIVESTDNKLEQQEILFTELDQILEELEDEQIYSILGSPVFRKIKDQLHRSRALYEYDREMLLADNIIATRSVLVAEDFRSCKWYDEALEFEISALAPYKRKQILFVGAGPFPVSPMAFLRANPSATVTCLERVPAACERARRVAKIFGATNLKIVNADGLDYGDFGTFDCVIVGLVVGFDNNLKAETVEHFLKNVPNDTLLCFRSAVGSGQVIYPVAQVTSLECRAVRVLKNPPHKSFTMVIVER